MRVFFGFFCCVLFWNCASVTSSKSAQPITGVIVDTLLFDTVSIRALAISGQTVFYAGSQSKIGCIDLVTRNHLPQMLPTVKPTEFRSLALYQGKWFALSIGNPALLYSGPIEGESSRLLYQESHEKVFYDALHFTAKGTGWAMGDPTQQAMALLKSVDGGAHWYRVPEDKAPVLAPGEAAFASSNTTICSAGKTLWIFTGGMQSRVWRSNDEGKTWESISVPIAQGSAMEGIFSADFYNAKIGVAAGGNYDKQTQTAGNLIFTCDGGSNWMPIDAPQEPGYISGIQFIPASKGKEWLTVGAGGLYYAYDQGKQWKCLWPEPHLYTLQFVDAQTVIVAGKNKIVRLQLQRN
ncbi:oxidoreductase [Flavobacterium sp.]|uniref:WD40/YVTN/BNR-like repeat-containing protein n=1 Tax=Flavobacterium sp. TaxID=239 RepID=UPI002638D7E0|nr:oxidoreductase [Flavobacterium sp.]